MLLLLNVPDRAVMDVMGWSEMSMLTRYQHVTDPLRQGIANQLEGLFWPPNQSEPTPSAIGKDDGLAEGPACT
jgi:hypothetical protein